MNPQASPRRWLALRLAIACACTVALVLFLYSRAQASHLGALLVRSSPQQILGDPRLLGLAKRQGPALYAQHCASCHGARLEGDRRAGVPNLADQIWLYGDGTINNIETTILYGIRSGHPKAHNLTDMPALGRVGQLAEHDIHDVVEYVLQLSRQPHDETAAQRGRELFVGAGVCYDCHGGDGEGVSDYGTPALTGRGGSWMYGGDRDTLFKSIYDGRHGLCPAWIGTLRFDEIRALSVYLYEVSHQ